MNNCLKVTLLIGLFIIGGVWLYLTVRDSHAYCTTSLNSDPKFSRSDCPSTDLEVFCPAYAATFQYHDGVNFLKAICPWSPPAWVSVAVGLAIIEVDLLCLMFTLATKKIDQTRRPKWILAGLIVISFLVSLGFVIRDIVVAAKYDINPDLNQTNKSLSHIGSIIYILAIFPVCLFVNWVHGMPVRKRSSDQVSPGSENITPGNFAVTPHGETVPMVSYNGAMSPPLNYTQAQQMQYPHNGTVPMVPAHDSANYTQVQQMQSPQSETAPMVSVHNAPN